MRYFDGARITRIRVPHDPRARIIGEHPAQRGFGARRAIGDDHDSGVQRVPHSDTSTVMEAHP